MPSYLLFILYVLQILDLVATDIQLCHTHFIPHLPEQQKRVIDYCSMHEQTSFIQCDASIRKKISISGGEMSDISFYFSVTSVRT